MTSTTAGARFRPNAARLGLLRGSLELKQFWRGRESVIFSFAFPLMLLVIFSSIFDYEIAPGLKFTQYFISGMLASALLTNGFQTLAIQIPLERDRGVLKRLAGSPLPPASYFIGKIIMVYVVGLISIVLVLALGTLLFGLDLPSSGEKWVTLVWVSLLGVAACTLCGIAFSSLPREGRRAAAVVTPVALVLQFISGVFFVFTDLPTWMQQIAAIFPLKWMTQGMRSVFLPDSYAAQEAGHSWELGKTALILGAWVIIGLVLCLATFRWTAREDR
jgi:ABC-2 type transport system permease protein